MTTFGAVTNALVLLALGIYFALDPGTYGRGVAPRSTGPPSARRVLIGLPALLFAVPPWVVVTVVVRKLYIEPSGSRSRMSGGAGLQWLAPGIKVTLRVRAPEGPRTRSDCPC